MSVPLAIVGYGKMGRMVEQFAAGIWICSSRAIDLTEMADAFGCTVKGAVMAIEFTSPPGTGESADAWPGLE